MDNQKIKWKISNYAILIKTSTVKKQAMYFMYKYDDRIFNETLNVNWNTYFIKFYWNWKLESHVKQSN